MNHPPTVCERQHKTRYICGGGRGAGHSDLFVCLKCQRETRQALNWLGQRLVMCDGVKFTKVRR